MEEKKKDGLQNKDLGKHVCCWGSDYYHCINCYWFDPNYKYGYCDYHQIETTPDNYCGNFKGK